MSNKISTKTINEILRLHDNGMTQREIALALNISKTTVLRHLHKSNKNTLSNHKSYKETVIKMLMIDDATSAEIMKATGCSYQYIYETKKQLDIKCESLMCFREIAERLGISQRTAWNDYRNSMNKIRQYLLDGGIDKEILALFTNEK